MITEDNAKEIAISVIGEQILENAFYIGDKPKDNWFIYNMPKNCIFICFSNTIFDIGVLSSSIVIAIDKETGQVKYFGKTNDEG